MATIPTLTYLPSDENVILQRISQPLPADADLFVVADNCAALVSVLVETFARELEIQGKGIMEAALEACRLRLRPIVMTSIAFIAGTIPLILGHGAGAEVRGVTGITVFSGMLGVTLFGLFLTPVFYVTLRKFVTRGKKEERDVLPA